MANDYRGPNRGMFGYEGEGFMRGEEDYDDFARGGFGRSGDDDGPHGGDAGYRGGGFMGGSYPGGERPRGPSRGQSGSMWGPGPSDSLPRGYSDLEAGPTDRGWNIGRGSDREDRPRQSYRGRGPKNYRRSDERIHEEVCERLSMDHDVDASDIEVSVAAGVVTLSGTVPERHAKRLAEDIADSVTGVNDVQNNLRVARTGQ